MARSKTSRSKRAGSKGAGRPLPIYGVSVFPMSALWTHGATLVGNVVPERYQLGPGRAKVAVREVGKLRLPSGRLVACDPMVGDGTRPFAERLEPGTYAVEVAQLRSPGSVIPLGIRLRVRAGEVTRWDAMQTKPFPVDSATACFIDAVAMKPLFAMQDLRDPMPVYERIWASTDGRLVLDAASGANIVTVRSGFGDGFYAAWAGRDASGALLSIAVDFRVLYTEETMDRRALARERDRRRAAR